jgi:hypothetical protein
MKHLYFIFLLLYIFTLVSCGDEKQAGSESDSTKVTQTTNVGVPTNGTRTFQLGKVKGYRIQVYTTLNREEALKYKAIFQKNFPDVPNYLVYEDPVYKVRIGDYLSKGEAKDFAVFVNKVKDLYGSFVVKCMINAIIKPNQDTVISITNTDSVGQVSWVDSTGKTIALPTEEVLTKEDVAAERKMQQEDKEEEKMPAKDEKVEPVKKTEPLKVEKNTKFVKGGAAKDSVKKK